MSASRFGRLQKASALVPLVVLSTAWTASVTGVGLSSASAGEETPPTLPDGTSIPTEAIEAPASVSSPGVVAPGIADDKVKRVVETASANGIPDAALAAYQRAETVINSADRSCNLSWQLVAAIGRVESDHGRANGNSLNSDGLARPGIYGVPLDGRQGTAVITDTDAGQYDSDAKYDRAVGPMQFIPSTWSVVGVDADGDAQRNPQDIDDAALATAVYLCSGRDNLSTEQGQRAAVYRYNHSQSYVDLVLSIMEQYLQGDFTSVPNSTTASAGYFVPAPTPPASDQGPKNDGPATGGSTGAPAPAPEPPASGGDGGGGGGGTTQPDTDGDGSTLPDTDTDGDGGSGGVKTPQLPQPDTEPIEDLLTPLEAKAECIAKGIIDLPLTGTNELQECINKLLNP